MYPQIKNTVIHLSESIIIKLLPHLLHFPLSFSFLPSSHLPSLFPALNLPHPSFLLLFFRYSLSLSLCILLLDILKAIQTVCHFTSAHQECITKNKNIYYKATVENPWMEEPGGLQSLRSLRVRHD